jgi:hypothetical protein
VVETGDLDSLSEEDRSRLLAYCFGQGYYPGEFYESVFENGVRQWAPIWDEIYPGGFRPEFNKEVERIRGDTP